MTNCQVQPGEGYPPSDRGRRAASTEGHEVLAALINAGRDEIVVGPSTSSNVYVLSHALKPLLAAGDEIIVTNQDHEANNGAWRRLESKGLVIREWRMNPETDDLELEDLEALLERQDQAGLLHPLLQHRRPDPRREGDRRPRPRGRARWPASTASPSRPTAGST